VGAEGLCDDDEEEPGANGEENFADPRF